ncbi:MAG: hypothetical protein KJ792_09710 [Actinobacteria bacterium]|nr:hypothetical protein [Actinomycetota bacterium]
MSRLSVFIHPERLRGGGRGTWFTVLGLVLVPLVVGGLLTWALWKPTEHLDRITAAVVNLDEPVTIKGQTVPLGRQLAAGLVTSSGADTSGSATASASPTPSASPTVANVSSSDSGSNLTWVVTSASDAAAGLANGSYTAVVTIPANFSAAATSTANGADAVQATLDIATSDKSRPLDPVLAQAVTTTATQILGRTLTTTYLQNVLVGFSTLGTSLADAASGAGQLATGSTALASGASSLATGSTDLAGGLSTLGTGSAGLAQGAGKLASGASSLASGLDQLASQTAASATTAQASVGGAQTFADGLTALAAGINGTASTPGLSQGASGLKAGTAEIATGASGLSRGLAAIKTVSEACTAGSTAMCGLLTQLVDLNAAPSPGNAQAGVPANLSYLVQASAGLSSGAATAAAGAASLDSSVNTGTSTTPALTTSTTQLAAAGQQLAAGAAGTATGLQTLAGYIQQSADGASALASGASSASTGAGKLAAGAVQAADGASQLATGASGLATGAAQVSEGAGSLSTGLGTAATQVPTYTKAESDHLASVVADPVTSASGSTDVFGSQIVAFLVTLALWIGGLATFLVLAAMTPRALGSTRPSWVLALRSFAPAAAVGVIQGLAITAVMSPTLDLTPGGWVRFTLVACLAGVAFAAVNQGLAAAFRGIGRFVAVLVATIGLAAAVVSTVPALVGSLYDLTPLGPALHGLQSVTAGGALAGPIGLLAVWTLAGLALTTAALARHRVVPAGQLARWSRAS